MKRKHRRTLSLLHAHPTPANIPWREIEALFVELGAEVSERRLFHRPHPSPHTDKGAVASIRAWLQAHGVTP